MEMPEILKRFNLHLDGVGLAGAIEKLTLPVIAATFEDFRGGGMDSVIDIDMGLEKMESEFTLAGMVVSVLRKAGAINSGVPITIYGAYKRDGEPAKPVKASGRVIIKMADNGSWEPGQKNQTTVKVSWRSYILMVDGEEIYNIDLDKGTRFIDGIDQLADELAQVAL